jgi:hypothetical protein
MKMQSRKGDILISPTRNNWKNYINKTDEPFLSKKCSTKTKRDSTTFIVPLENYYVINNEERSSNTSTQAIIYWTNKKLPVLLPPIELQNNLHELPNSIINRQAIKRKRAGKIRGSCLIVCLKGI